ncbi:sin3 histone deacetylase corepressor complex component SDS3 isoform X4 [Myotis daubentonii]|nr:sin3 histone deacetylase corepressor complex component SDS3 isoform X4 [Myotis daubentonii]
MKKLDQQYKERIRNAELFLQLETEQVERNYIKEKKAAVKEFEDKKVELKENLIAELEEKKKMIENEKLTMELTGDSMEVKPIMTRKLRRRPNDPVPIPDKRRKLSTPQLNYLLTDEQIMEDLRTLNKLKSPKRPASPSSPEHLPATPAESPAQRFEARIEDGKLYYDKRWYHKSQAIYLESKDNQKLSCVISSVGANEIWVRKTSDSTKMRIYLGQLQRGLFVIRRSVLTCEMGEIAEPAPRGCCGDEVRNMREAWTRPGMCCQEVPTGSGFSTEKRKVARLSGSETLTRKTLLDAGSLFSVCVFDSELISVISVACLPVAAGLETEIMRKVGRAQGTETGPGSGKACRQGVERSER